MIRAIPIEPLEKVEGGLEAIVPQTSRIRKDYAVGEPPIYKSSVTVACESKRGKEFFEIALAESPHSAIANPHSVVWFVVKVDYRWERADHMDDYDEVITNGSEFYLSQRNLGVSPFILNDYTESEILKAIKDFVS